MKYAHENGYDIDIMEFLSDYDSMKRRITSNLKTLNNSQKQAYESVRDMLERNGLIESLVFNLKEMDKYQKGYLSKQKIDQAFVAAMNSKKKKGSRSIPGLDQELLNTLLLPVNQSSDRREYLYKEIL